MNTKKTVLIACGTGIATSTVVNSAVQKIAKEHNLDINMIQCKMMEVPGYADRADLLITTTVVDKDQYKFPVIDAPLPYGNWKRQSHCKNYRRIKKLIKVSYKGGFIKWNN